MRVSDLDTFELCCEEAAAKSQPMCLRSKALDERLPACRGGYEGRSAHESTNIGILRYFVFCECFTLRPGGEESDTSRERQADHSDDHRYAFVMARSRRDRVVGLA